MSFERLYPPDRAVLYGRTVRGNSIAGRVTMPRAPADADTYRLAGRKIHSIYIDPQFTSPGSLIGVLPQGFGEWLRLRPGEGIELPSPIDSFRAHDATWLPGLGYLDVSCVFGAAAFLCGTGEGRGLPMFARSGATAGPDVSLLAQGPISIPVPADQPGFAGTAPYVWVPAHGLRGLRVTIFPRKSTGEHFTFVSGDVPPADLRIVARPSILTGAISDPETATYQPETVPWGPTASAFPVPGDGGSSRRFWAPSSDNDLVVTQFNVTQEMAIPAGAAAVTFALVENVGTGILSQHTIAIEGY